MSTPDPLFSLVC